MAIEYMIEYELNKQVDFRFPHSKVKKVFWRLNQVLKLRGKKSVSIALVGESAIKKLNFAYRGKNKVTDVLSFAIQENRGKECFCGEIIICIPQLKKQAKLYHKSINEELLLLLTHGFLHLLGYDHEKDGEAKVMESLERKILNY